jgi:hypothetical protein
VYLDALRALRRLAPRVTGQLLDTLLDPEADPQLRGRVPRVLKACPTQRAADGLLAALEDPDPELRAQCALALAALSHAPGVRLPAERVFGAVRRELGAPAPDLDHVFTLLSLVLEREPLEIAAWALRGADARLRGTALEYLDNVLPAEIRAALRPHVGSPPAAPRARPREELLGELLRSAEGTAAVHGPTRSRRVRRPD